MGSGVPGFAGLPSKAVSVPPGSMGSASTLCSRAAAEPVDHLPCGVVTESPTVTSRPRNVASSHSVTYARSWRSPRGCRRAVIEAPATSAKGQLLDAVDDARLGAAPPLGALHRHANMRWVKAKCPALHVRHPLAHNVFATGIRTHGSTVRNSATEPHPGFAEKLGSAGEEGGDGSAADCPAGARGGAGEVVDHRPVEAPAGAGQVGATRSGVRMRGSVGRCRRRRPRWRRGGRAGGG